MTQVSVREMESEDRKGVYEVWCASLREGYTEFLDVESVEARISLSKKYKEPERFSEVLKDENRTNLVAEMEKGRRGNGGGESGSEEKEKRESGREENKSEVRGRKIVGIAEYLSSENPEKLPGFVGTDEVLLSGLYVHPDHWSEGVGTALLNRGFEVFSDFERMKLHCFSGNEIGKRFYEKRGFENLGTTKTEKYVGKEDEEPIIGEFEGIIYSQEI